MSQCFTGFELNIQVQNTPSKNKLKSKYFKKKNNGETIGELCFT